MATLRSGTVALALLALLANVAGCARRPYLHWQGGDVFGVFEADERSPSRIDCPGTTEERFACFAAKTRERVTGTSGALAVIAADGVLLQTTTTEPGQTVPTTSETLFPLLSVTKMFTAATAVLLAREGILELHRPIRGGDSLLNPTTLVEVLSPSTEDYDRGGKFDDEYRWIPSLREYVLVAQDEARVEVRSRDDQENWTTSVYRDGQQARLGAIGATLDVAVIYREAKKNAPG